MTPPLPITTARGPGDAELIAEVRAGDVDASGLLFERHVEAARRLAGHLTSSAEVDDLVADSFAEVVNVLQRGGGPDLAFRVYFLTSLRRLHLDRVGAIARTPPAEDPTASAAQAFADLPERWQMVLWHTEVEKLRPQEIAPLLGISTNSVAVLSFRAREGLRQSFVCTHAKPCSDEECGRAREVGSDLGAWLAPVLLGAAGSTYLVTAGSLTGLSAAVVSATDRLKDTVAHPTAMVGSALVAAAAAALGFALLGSPLPGDGPDTVTGAESSTASEAAPSSVVDDASTPVPEGGSSPLPDVVAATNTTIGVLTDTTPVEVIPDTAPTSNAEPTASIADDTTDGPQANPLATPDPVDLSLRVSRGTSTLTTQGFGLDVVGLPKGRTATLVITEEVGRGRQVVSDDRCTPTRAGAECAVSSRPDPFRMALSRTECSTYLVQVLLNEGIDPSPGDNSTRVTLGNPTTACLTTGVLTVTLKGERRRPVRP